MKLVVAIQVLQVVVQHNKRFTSGLGNPVDAAIDADNFRVIVILNPVNPGQRVGEDEVQANVRQTQVEVSFR